MWNDIFVHHNFFVASTSVFCQVFAIQCNILENINLVLTFYIDNFCKTYIEMVFTNVYMTVLNFSWITSTSGMKPNTFIFSAGAGTLMKILLVESALLLGHNFVTHSLFRGIFFEILEFRFHRHSLTVTVQ